MITTVIKTPGVPKPPKPTVVKPPSQPKPPGPPKPPKVATAGLSLLGASALTKPPKRTATGPGSALLNGARSLTQAPAQAPPVAPQVAPAPAPVPTGTTGTAGTAGNELDAAYYNNVAANNVKVGNSINSINLGIGQQQGALQATLNQLVYQQPRDQLALEERANAGGGLYSSVYNQNLGNLNFKYATNQSNAQTKYNNYYNTAEGRINALLDAQKAYDSAQALASTGRLAAAAASNPAEAAPPAPPQAPTPASPPAPTATMAPKGGGKGGKGKATGVGSALLNLAKNLSKGKK